MLMPQAQEGLAQGGFVQESRPIASCRAADQELPVRDTNRVILAILVQKTLGIVEIITFSTEDGHKWNSIWLTLGSRLHLLGFVLLRCRRESLINAFRRSLTMSLADRE